MRILHVIPRYWPFVGGSELHLAAYAERQAAAGHRVSVWATDIWDLEYLWDRTKRRIEPTEEEHRGVAIRRFPVRQLPGGKDGFAVLRRILVELSAARLPPTWLLERLARLAPRVPDLERALAAASPVDLVHAMNVGLESIALPAERYARRVGARFCVSPLLHLAESPRSRVRRYYTMRHQLGLLRRADAVLANTPTELDFLREAGVVPERLVLAGVGVDPPDGPDGDPARFRARHAIAGPFVAFVGANAYDKGAVHVVEAMRQLWRAGRDEPLVIAGPPMDHFTAHLDAIPPAERARLRVLGFIPDQDKRDLMAAGAVLAMPSRTDSFGTVYLEAWLAGRPVIGARAGGVPDVIADGVDGHLVPFGDVPTLAAHFARLLDDPALADRMGAAGRAKVLAHHTWDHVYARARRAFADAD